MNPNSPHGGSSARAADASLSMSCASSEIEGGKRGSQRPPFHDGVSSSPRVTLPIRIQDGVIPTFREIRAATTLDTVRRSVLPDDEGLRYAIACFDFINGRSRERRVAKIVSIRLSVAPSGNDAWIPATTALLPYARQAAEEVLQTCSPGDDAWKRRLPGSIEFITDHLRDLVVFVDARTPQELWGWVGMHRVYVNPTTIELFAASRDARDAVRCARDAVRDARDAARDARDAIRNAQVDALLAEIAWLRRGEGSTRAKITAAPVIVGVGEAIRTAERALAVATSNLDDAVRRSQEHDNTVTAAVVAHEMTHLLIRMCLENGNFHTPDNTIVDESATSAGVQAPGSNEVDDDDAAHVAPDTVSATASPETVRPTIEEAGFHFEKLAFLGTLKLDQLDDVRAARDCMKAGRSLAPPPSSSNAPAHAPPVGGGLRAFSPRPFFR